MAVPSAYLTKTNSLKALLGALQRAGVPDRFNREFLHKQLGFTSSADRPVINVLKALRFLDDAGVPLERYKRYRDPTEAPTVLAEAIRDAYADVFSADEQAQKLSVHQLKGLFARLSGKGDSVVEKMATTFRALVGLANFEAVPGELPAPESDRGSASETEDARRLDATAQVGTNSLQLHHDVHIHLPVSNDIAVYDAIFRSMREHLGLR